MWTKSVLMSPRHAPRLPPRADRRRGDRPARPTPAPARLSRHHGDGRGLWHRRRHDLPIGRQGVRAGLHGGARTGGPASGAAGARGGRLGGAGALVGALVRRKPLGTGTSALVGALAGLGASAAGGLALLQPAGQEAPRRAVGLALTLLAVSSLVAPSPLAVAAASVMKASNTAMLMVALPLAAIAALLGWWSVARQIPSTAVAGRLDWTWLAVLVPIALLIV